VWCETWAFPIPPQRARAANAWRQLKLNARVFHNVHGVVLVHTPKVSWNVRDVVDDAIGGEVLA
jgi:hypothetical protein